MTSSASTRTPISIEVRPVQLRLAFTRSRSLTCTGAWKSTRSIDAVITRPPECRAATMAAVLSMSLRIVLPWMLPPMLASSWVICWTMRTLLLLTVFPLMPPFSHGGRVRARAPVARPARSDTGDLRLTQRQPLGSSHAKDAGRDPHQRCHLAHAEALRRDRAVATRHHRARRPAALRPPRTGAPPAHPRPAGAGAAARPHRPGAGRRGRRRRGAGPARRATAAPAGADRAHDRRRREHQHEIGAGDATGGERDVRGLRREPVRRGGAAALAGGLRGEPALLRLLGVRV